MTYMTIDEQIKSHVNFLRLNGFDVNELKLNSGFIRCKFIGQLEDRGELCYKTTQSLLNNGMLGFATWCRSQGGVIKVHKTYGINSEENRQLSLDVCTHQERNRELARKSELFWEYSEQIGDSDYLRRKGVGYYGVRFRNNEYGRVAVIPLRDIEGKLWSYQLLNSDGTKRLPKNINVGGLFHALQPFVNGQPIGLSESYVVAAACYEAIGLATVTAISVSNLERVAQILRNRYPNSRIVIFADNDRHLLNNKGVQAAYSIRERLKTNCIVAIPDFDGFPKSKDYTDWNDLIREKGMLEVRNMLTKQLMY
jgi:phage/plasmid primase-like uncharacterized protein